MIRGILILVGVALVPIGIILAVASGFTIDGRFLLISGGGLALAVLADRHRRNASGGRPA